MLEVVVGSVAACRGKPYVYIGFSRAAHVAYVGQTLDRRGFVGRWVDHLSRDEIGSSFRRRLAEHDESSFDRITDLRVVAWELTTHSEFASIESSHREAVEYLVQRELWGFCGELDPWLTLISKVRPTVATRRPHVREIAERVVGEFRSYYEALPPYQPA